MRCLSSYLGALHLFARLLQRDAVLLAFVVAQRFEVSVEISFDEPGMDEEVDDVADGPLLVATLAFACGDNLRIVVVTGGGADDEVALPQIVRSVTDGNRNTERAQMLHIGIFAHVNPAN